MPERDQAGNAALAAAIASAMSSRIGAGIEADDFVGVGRIDVFDTVRADPFAVDQVLMDGHGLEASLSS